MTRGINLDNLYEFLKCNREIDFTYAGKMYAMQPEVHDGIAYPLNFSKVCANLCGLFSCCETAVLRFPEKGEIIRRSYNP